MQIQGIKFSIADKASNAIELAKFFSGNLTTEYISHSELQSYRAVRPGEWAKNIENVLRTEIAARLPNATERNVREWKGVVEAFIDGRLAALALVTMSREAVVPYGIIEDIVVDENRRSQGLGESMIQWIIGDLRRNKIRRVFLESGNENDAAHYFFERQGFKQLSIVMMRDISGN